MELVIAKWKQPHNGAEYTMHFAEDANWFTIICEIDEVGDPKCCEIRLIDTWGQGMRMPAACKKYGICTSSYGKWRRELKLPVYKRK